jgi:SNF2 family DNA or RNA helicase
MGLGKTVQVLALLESRRQARHDDPSPTHPRPGASLAVVPKSLIFNWQNEAARFTPEMRVLDYTGTRRKELFDAIEEHDLVLTTYGTLLRDITALRTLKFDYAILDEAQAIKNHKSATAKACRLLQAQHRLALTGTPIENHVGDLMSLLDFLNPGLFGPGRRLRVPKGLRDGALQADGTPHPELALIAGAARPFLLRRTKGQVAKDLPEKFEQTLYCELPSKQRKDYDQLREHYRQSLLGQVDTHGLARSKMHVLEALLRLRQAACHPGLIDRKRQDDDSGKLAVLLPQLAEVIEEGHKALVFSQFTSMLGILRSRLDAAGTVYEYLDGRTRKREPRIRRFQEDPDCRLFLISLKAGGVGLNLTAAEYVFLLDPWWNPAVEAQAIDRTHRIGQTRKVFAYSLIARDTVEEKVLELQRTKRELADAIVRADSSLIRSLTREDLVQILS